MAGKAQMATLMPIRNMDRAIKFYTKSLGAKLQMRADGPMKDMWASIKVGTHDIWLIAPEKREKRNLAYSTFVVGNIKSWVGGAAKKGVKFEKATKDSPDTKVDGPIAFNPWGASAFFKDSEGNMLMVWQDMM